MHLLVVHYHWRPGGVRQVVEHWIRELAAARPAALQSLTLAAGEPPPAPWAQTVEHAIGSALPLRFLTHPLLGYSAEWPRGSAGHLRELDTLAQALVHDLGRHAAVVLENPAVGRHPLLARAFAEATATHGVRLLCHHHDFFVDARWARRPEWRAGGLHTFEDAWEAMVPRGPHILHATVTHRDTRWLGPHRPTIFLPNRLPPPLQPAPEDITAARQWMRHQLGNSGPVWLCPTRILRRKNLVEAALLARLTEDTVTLATTGAASSPDESIYASAIARQIHLGGAGVAAGLLRLADSAGLSAPGVPALMAAADRVVVSSLYEGFGLPVAEAASLGAHTLARLSACPDDRPPSEITAYSDLHIPGDMPGASDDRRRQYRAWEAFERSLPPDVATALAAPSHWKSADSLPFSRLTLAGQLHVLSIVARSPATAAEIRRHNPWMAEPAGHTPQAEGSPQEAPGPATSLTDWLTDAHPAPASIEGPTATPRPHPLATRFAWANHYPLLWPGGDHPTP